MSSRVIKFHGEFELENTDEQKKYLIPTQIFFDNDEDKYVIFLYEFKSKIQPPWLNAIITGIISYFGLEPTSTVAMASEGVIVNPGEDEPENQPVYVINYHWSNGNALVNEIKEFKND